MGDNSTAIQHGRKFIQSNRRALLYSLLYIDYSNINPPPEATMEQKVMSILLNFLLSSGYGMVILLNIQDAKGWILFAIAVLYGLARLFFYCIKQNQERKMRDLDILEKARRFKR